MVVHVADDETFESKMAEAGQRLVAVGFFTNLSPLCEQIRPHFESISDSFPDVVFLRVESDVSPFTALSQAILAMPAFVFYRDAKEVSRLQTANSSDLVNKLQELVGSPPDDKQQQQVRMENGDQVDLVPMIDKFKSECLNDSDSHPFAETFLSGDSYLESDCDEQLLMSFGFHQPVKLHSLRIRAPADNGPKTLRLFINLPYTLDFDQADKVTAVQEIELNPDDLDGETPVLLRYVKFQNVQNVQVFVKDNQGGRETTRIDRLVFVGTPISTTKMADFKRVSGEKGLSHC